MKIKFIVSLALAALSLPTWAADLANGQRLAKSCALCHGQYGQGTSGTLSPRIAGMPKEYIIKAIGDYVDDTRHYALMVKTAKLDQMSKKDIDDVATYISLLDVSSDARFNIEPKVGGDVKAGRKIYRKECKTCHANDGYGKPRKEAPPLAGQHTEYLYTTMLHFSKAFRIHANDPEDDIFTDFEEEDFRDITAYLASLDDAKIVEGFAFSPPTYQVASTRRTSAEESGIEITDIKQTVVKMRMDKGVTPEVAEAAMLAKAEEIGLKKVAQQKVSKFLSKKGVKMPHLSIYQFCNPLDARLMVIADPVFSSYMPCRVSMVEDKDGQLWLMMLNLDMLINSKLLPDEVVETAVRVNQQMLDVMTAGAQAKG